MTATGLINHKYHVYDGSDTKNCENVNRAQWTYNAGALLLGAANMYNCTDGSDLWGARTWGLLQGMDVFFKNSVMQEIACEPSSTCNVDQLSFKAYLSRWMAATIKMAPFTHDTVMSYLRPSAEAAAKQCSSGSNSRQCGISWTTRSPWDDYTGVGQQMSALEVIQSNLIDQVPGPFTSNTGGTSKGDRISGHSKTHSIMPPTAKDKIGAGFLTSAVMVIFLRCGWWMIKERSLKSGSIADLGHSIA